MEDRGVEISVVIPVYKAQECLQELYIRLTKSLEELTSSFEIILIEDCGGDLSWEIIKSIGNRDSRVKGIQFSRNFGQHSGISAGLDLSVGEWVVIMDCDLQERPEDIGKLYQRAKEGYDIVLTSRKNRKHGRMKIFWAKVYYWLYEYFTDTAVDGSLGNFTMLSKKVVHTLRTIKEQSRSYATLVYFKWLGFHTTCIEIEHEARFAGKSSYSMLRLMKMGINSIVAYSNKPLRMSIWFGFSIALAAILFACYLVLRYIMQGIGVEGWTTVVVSIWLLAGLGFINMGIMGLYIGKIYEETKERPIYVIGESVNVK